MAESIKNAPAMNKGIFTRLTHPLLQRQSLLSIVDVVYHRHRRWTCQITTGHGRRRNRTSLQGLQIPVNDITIICETVPEGFHEVTTAGGPTFSVDDLSNDFQGEST